MDIYYIVIAAIWGIASIVYGITAGYWFSNKKYGPASLMTVASFLGISMSIAYTIQATGVWS